MKRRMLVLRADAALDGALDFRSAEAWRAAGPSALDVSIEEAEDDQVGELRDDPHNAAVIDAEVPLALIEPLASADADDLGMLTIAGTVQMPPGLLAVGAHTSPFTGQGVTVAVLDTGVDVSHPAFAAIPEKPCRNFTSDGAAGDVTDQNGHGTHCTGTICGGEVQGVRVGVAPGVTKLCAGKVLGKKGGTLEWLVKGLFWAVVEQKAAVVSMSLGYDLPGYAAKLQTQHGVPAVLATNAAMRLHGELLRTISTLRAFLQVHAPNVVLVAATGNESDRPRFALDAGLPAAELFSVGAVGAQGDKWSVASFSNGRAHVVAPGVDVVSAKPGGGWAVMSGTSMATPHVAGVAALWRQKLGAPIVPDAIVGQVKSSATRAVLVEQDPDAVGAGMVRAPQD